MNRKASTITHSLEVVGHLELVLLVSHVALHLGVGVVDDGQEHVDQHEEHEEHEQHEEDGAEDSVGRFQLVEVEVSQDDSEQGKAGMWETSGILGANVKISHSGRQVFQTSYYYSIKIFNQ